MLKKLLFSSVLLTSAFFFSACKHTGKKACCSKGEAHHKHHEHHKHSKGSSCCGAATSVGEAVVTSLVGPSKPVSGKVFFQSVGDHKVKVSAKVTGLPANKKFGFHVHEFGTCEDSGLRAGGHFNPWKKKHGGANTKERHFGDLGNLSSDSQGQAVYSTVIKGRPSKFFGRAVIIHKNWDDLSSQPTGNSGKRLACGVITASMPPHQATGTSKTRSPAKKLKTHHQHHEHVEKAATHTSGHHAVPGGGHHEHAGKAHAGKATAQGDTQQKKTVQKSSKPAVPARGSASAAQKAPAKKAGKASPAPASSSTASQPVTEPSSKAKATGKSPTGKSPASKKPKSPATASDKPKTRSVVPAVSESPASQAGATSKASDVKKEKQASPSATQPTQPTRPQTGSKAKTQPASQPPAKKQAPAANTGGSNSSPTGN